MLTSKNTPIIENTDSNTGQFFNFFKLFNLISKKREALMLAIERKDRRARVRMCQLAEEVQTIALLLAIERRDRRARVRMC